MGKRLYLIFEPQAFWLRKTPHRALPVKKISLIWTSKMEHVNILNTAMTATVMTTSGMSTCRRTGCRVGEYL